jgi:hypothetical protein
MSFDDEMRSTSGYFMSMSAPGTPMHVSDPDVMSPPGTPQHCTDAPSDDMDDLARFMQSTNLDGKREGQWAYLSPGMTREEQLRVISGEQSVTTPKKSGEEKKTGENMTAQQAMNEHLAMLAAHSSNTPSTPSATRQLPTPPSTPESPLELLKAQYREALRTGTSPTALARAPLPKNTQELESLSVYIANEVYIYAQERGLGGVVFSPLCHPCYPHWLPGSYMHPATPIVQRVFEQMTGKTEASSGADLSSEFDADNDGYETEEDEDTLNEAGSMAMDISFGR